MLYRIDPATGKIEASVDVGEGGCYPAQAESGRIFIAGCEGGDVVVVDPQKEQVVATSQCGGWMTFAAGSLWSSGGDRILRCDPQTYRATTTIKLPGSFAGLAYADGTIWAANMSDATVERIDPATNKVVATISAGAQAHGDVDENLLVAFGSVWVSSDYDTRIFRIDPSNNAVHVYRPKARSLGDFDTRTLVAGMGSLWMRTSPAKVSRFDPRTMKVVRTYPTDPWGGGGGLIAIAGGSLWVPNPEEDTLWREPVHQS
jgi:YVTN family beta-propeller protein